MLGMLGALGEMLGVAKGILRAAGGCSRVKGMLGAARECSGILGMLGAGRKMLKDAEDAQGRGEDADIPGGGRRGRAGEPLEAAGRRCGGPGAAGAEPQGAPPDGSYKPAGLRRGAALAGAPRGRGAPLPAACPQPARSPAPWPGGGCRGAPGGLWCCWD